MTAADVLAMIPIGGASGVGGKLLYDFLKDRFFAKQQPMTPVNVIVGDKHHGSSSSSSSDRIRALTEQTADRIESLHSALARENPNTGANVLLESVSKINETLSQQTKILDQLAGLGKDQTHVLEEQTALLRNIAEGRKPLDTRYRG